MVNELPYNHVGQTSSNEHALGRTGFVTNQAGTQQTIWLHFSKPNKNIAPALMRPHNQMNEHGVHGWARSITVYEFIVQNR